MVDRSSEYSEATKSVITNQLFQVAKMANEAESFETKAIHAGQEYDQWSNKEIIPPIVTTLTFFQDDPTNMQVLVLHCIVKYLLFLFIQFYTLCLNFFHF